MGGRGGLIAQPAGVGGGDSASGGGGSDGPPRPRDSDSDRPQSAASAALGGQIDSRIDGQRLSNLMDDINS